MKGIAASVLASALFGAIYYLPPFLAPLDGEQIFGWRMLLTWPFTSGLLVWRGQGGRVVDLLARAWANWRYGALLLLRMLTMYLVTFEPPPGIIPLVDPVTALFYPGSEPFLKDLFFSGHTATPLLFALAVGPGRGRMLLAACAAVVGALVIVQQDILDIGVAGGGDPGDICPIPDQYFRFLVISMPGQLSCPVNQFEIHRR